MCCCVLLCAVQIFSTDQQLAFELQGSSFKLVVGTLQVTALAPFTCARTTLQLLLLFPHQPAVFNSSLMHRGARLKAQEEACT